MLVHVGVGSNGAQLLCDVNSVLANELAVGKVGVSVNAHLGALEVLVEDVEHVDVSGREFSRVDRQVVEHACCFVNRGRESATNVRFAVSWFNA